MAERRMFAKSVVCFDILPDLSHGAQALYFHLNMQADDDGFVGNPKPILRQCRCTQRQLEELEANDLVLQMDTGPVVVTHWHVHNQIRKDRHKPTLFRKEQERLICDQTGAYRLATNGCQTAASAATQGREAEQSIVKPSQAKQSLVDERLVEQKHCDQMGSQALDLSSSSISYLEEYILQLYKKYCGRMIPCIYLTDNVRERIPELQKDKWLLENLEEAFKMAGETDFLCGENKDGWVASLDWLCEGDRLKRVLSGMYASYRKKVPMGATGLGDAEIEAVHLLLSSD